MSYYNTHITDGFVCPYADDTRKMEKTMTFRRENIIESIRVMAGIVAIGLKDSENTDETKHHLDDIAEGGNMDRLNEVIDIALLECLEILEKVCSMDEVGGDDLNDDYTLRDEWRVKLSLPGKTHEHTAELICKYIHELVCLIAIGDFLGLIGSGSDVINGRIEDMLDKIGKSILGKKRTTRPMTII